MSDGSGEGAPGKKKRSLTSRLKKIPNPFKKSQSDTEDEGSASSSTKSRRSTSSNASQSLPSSGNRSPVMAEHDASADLAEVKEVVQGALSDSKKAVEAAMASAASSSMAEGSGTRSLPTKLPSSSASAGGDAAAKGAEEKGGEGKGSEGGGRAHGVADIVMTGIKGEAEQALKALRERGFVVHLAMLEDDTDPPTMTVALALGPKLLTKCAEECKLPVKKRIRYTGGEVLRLCAEAMEVIRRSSIEYKESHLLHDKEALAEVLKTDRANAADAVNGYFGPYVGLYFAWLRFYTRALIFPAVVGSALWVFQWRTGTADGPLLPAACMLMMIWATVFLELWRRRNREFSFRWGVDNLEEEEHVRIVAAKAEHSKRHPIGKYCLTVPIILGAIYAVIRVMLYCTWVSDNAVEIYGSDSYTRYVAVVLYSLVPLVAASLYRCLAKALNDYEDHATPVRKKNMFVMKMFAFQFVNSYCALIYVAFWLRNLQRLRVLLMTMVMVKQFVSQLQEKYQPRLFRWWRNRQAKKEPNKEPHILVKYSGTVTPEGIREELRAGSAKIEEDYLEMVLQFGYISMFAVVFPLAPFFAVANNLWEFKLDLSILGISRRPQAHAESTIGAWQLCLEVIGVVACLTNLLLALFVSEKGSLYVPQGLSDHLGSFEGKVVLAVVVEHLLILVKVVMTGLVDSTPRLVREAQVVIADKEKEERKAARRLASGLPPSQVERSRSREASPADRLRQLHKTFNVWEFGPLWFLPLALLPFLAAWFEIRALWVLPLAFIFVSYLQNLKDKADVALSMGIVKDPQVLKLVTKFLPAWYKESDVERVEWLNKILQKLWVSASAATKNVFFTTIQPILDSYRPPGVTALGFRKVSLGTIPPKVVGIRTLGMQGNKAVFDLDLRWAGNAEFVLEAGVKPVPLLVTLDKLRFSGRLRVELAPLVPVFPCFGAIVLTFMEKPFLDFSFSLGKLDVMSIGPGDASIGAAVSNVIKNVMDGMMVFPKKMVVPVLMDQDLLELGNPVPKGVVELTVVGADNLRSADVAGKSDPYVKIRVGQGEQVQTDVKSNTLCPRWGETFDLLVYEPSVEVINFKILDQDTAGKDDSLGYCELPISVLEDDVESAHNIALAGTKTGSLLIKATFVPLSSAADQKGEDEDEDEEEDVLVNMAGDVITDESVAADVYQEVPAAVTAAPSKPGKKKPTDPTKLRPTLMVSSDMSMGVLTVMGIECKGVKAGDRYVSVVLGNTKRKTPIERGKTSFAYSDVFHFLVRGAKSAVLEVLLKEDERIGHDKVVGKFKVYVAEVIANEDQLDGEWDLTGEKAQGSIKMRLKWSGRASQEKSG